MDYENQFNAHALPRTYVPSWSFRIFLYLFSLLLSIGGAYLLLILAGFLPAPSSLKLPFGAVIGISISLMLLGIYTGLSTFRSQVIIDSHEISICKGLSTQRLPLNEIVGYRAQIINGIKVLLFEPKSKAYKPIKLELYFTPDTVFLNWLKDIEDLQHKDLAASIQKIEQDSRLGNTPEARVKNIAKAKKFVTFLSVIPGLAFVLSMIKPVTFDGVIIFLNVFPVLTLFLGWKMTGLFGFVSEIRTDVRGNLLAVLMPPIVILVLITITNTHILNWQPLLLPASVLGILMLLPFVTLIADVRKSKIIFSFIAILMFFYSASLILLTNQKFDPVRPDFYRVNILDKRQTTGKGANQFFQVTEWAQFSNGNELSVPRDFYQLHGVGDTICIQLHPGYLGIEWFSVANEC